MSRKHLVGNMVALIVLLVMGFVFGYAVLGRIKYQ
jgi:hypothetical protein